jgi:hypothetical protein
MSEMTPAEAARELGSWLDSRGHLPRWPTKRKFQRAAMFYLIAKFEQGRAYSELEVGERLDRWAPFRDAPLLRRTMIEERLMERTADGREYRVTAGAD